MQLGLLEDRDGLQFDPLAIGMQTQCIAGRMGDMRAPQFALRLRAPSQVRFGFAQRARWITGAQLGVAGETLHGAQRRGIDARSVRPRLAMKRGPPHLHAAIGVHADPVQTIESFAAITDHAQFDQQGLGIRTGGDRVEGDAAAHGHTQENSGSDGAHGERKGRRGAKFLRTAVAAREAADQRSQAGAEGFGAATLTASRADATLVQAARTSASFAKRVPRGAFMSFRSTPMRLAAAVAIACTVSACMAPVRSEYSGGEYRKRGAEPVDPAEYREPVLPPERPDKQRLLGAPPSALAWIERGPAPTRSAQVRVPPNNEVCGGIHALAPHPTNANILYIGAVNGGIWRTGNALAASPTWTPQTDQLPSQSIGALAFDPTDTSHQTLVAGLGRWSNFGQRGDDEVGVYRTTNGGTTWTQLGASALLGQKMVAVWPRGATILAAARNGGLWRSTDTGASWSLVSGTGGLPAGGIGDMAAHPDAPLRVYISVLGATRNVLRSDDGGATWTDISAGITAMGGSSGNVRLAVGPGASGAVFVAVVNTGALAGVFRSANQGTNWTAMDVPPVHPGTQGVVNTSIVVDPGNPNLVYIGGDRITASPFTANIRRGDATAVAGSQFTTIMDANAGNTTPHADSRNMAFDVNGNLLQVDDGCIYRRATPTSSAGTWASVAGNLKVMEVHDLDHDRVSDILVIGTQDNGTHMQQAATNPIWVSINGGDGGDVAIEDSGTDGLRFISSQNLGGFRRATYSAANAQTANVSVPTGGIVTDPQFVTPVEVNVDDPSRMLVGGINTLYESSNANAGSPTLASIGGPGANRNAMAYGASGNPGVAYVGRGSQVFQRTTGGFVATTALPAGASTVTDVALDPTNPARVWAIDDNQVFFSSNSGTSWTDITGNLPSISSQDFRTIEFINADGAVPARIALGTRSGVYAATSGTADWALFGDFLPDVLVFDLRYVHDQRTLYAGTLGRGVWSVGVVAGRLFSNGFEP